MSVAAVILRAYLKLDLERSPHFQSTFHGWSAPMLRDYHCESPREHNYSRDRHEGEGYHSERERERRRKSCGGTDDEQRRRRRRRFRRTYSVQRLRTLRASAAGAAGAPSPPRFRSPFNCSICRTSVLVAAHASLGLPGGELLSQLLVLPLHHRHVSVSGR